MKSPRDLVVARSVEEVGTLRSTWEELLGREVRVKYDADINRFLDVLEVQPGQCTPYVVSVKSNGRTCAMLLGRISRKPISIQLGYKTITLSELRTLSVIYGGLLGEVTEETMLWLWEQLQHDLRGGELDAIYLKAVPVDSAACTLFRRVPAVLTKDLFPRYEPHWRMSVPDSMDVLYAGLSGKRRYNLRRTVRAFDEAFGSRSIVRAYSTKADVPSLAAQAEAIAAKTYQRGMRVGFRDSPEMRLLLTRAAGRGWLRGHVLTVDGEPCAFQMGFVYRGTYSLDYIGYLPELKDHSPGTVLFLEVLQTLCADPGVHALDFGYGDQQSKQVYGEECWEEASFYVFAPRLRPRLLNGVRTCMVAVERGLKGLARRFALDGWIKRRWRDRLAEGRGR